MYCIHKSMRGEELSRRLPHHRNVERAEIILHPRMGGHCVVPHNNGPAYLGTEMVEDGPAGRVFDDELNKQLHGGVGQASHPAASTKKMTRWSGSFAKSPRTCQLINTELVCPGSGSARPTRRR